MSTQYGLFTFWKHQIHITLQKGSVETSDVTHLRIREYFLRRLLEVHARFVFPLIQHKTSGFSRRRKTNTSVAARESVVRSRGLSGDEVCLQSFHSRRTKRAKVGRGVIQVLWVAREFNPTTEHPKDHKGHGKRESTVTGIQVCVCVRLRDP